MTTVNYLSKKEMTEETGMPSYGYAQPDKNRILLRKGMGKSLEREVRAHEFDHISKGEEGPFLHKKIAKGVRNIGRTIDKGVRDIVPGGWKTLAVLAGGYALGGGAAFGGSGFSASKLGSSLGMGGAGAAAGAAAGAGAGIAPWLIGGASLGSAYLGNKAAGKAADASAKSSAASIAEQQRQFDLNRADAAPWREAGQNALGMLGDRLEPGATYDEDGIPQFNYQGQQPEFNYGDAPPEYQNNLPVPEFQGGEALPEFNNNALVPRFQGGDRFDFDLEGDAGYQFAKKEGIRATVRQAASVGKRNSGEVQAAIADRVTGIASQYTDQAFNRQMGTSRENYGRDVGEFGLDRGTERDQYGRDLGKFDIDYQRNQDTYGRGVQAFGFDVDANRTRFDRNITQYGLDTGRENVMYGRGVDQYGRDTSRERDQYGRAVSQYGFDAAREGDIYGRDQNYLNRLASMSNVGQTTVAQGGVMGANMAANIGNINARNTSNQINAINTRYQGFNNAVQGGISNYLTYQGTRQPGALPPITESVPTWTR